MGQVIHKYEITINWSNDDQAFIAEVPELPGCVAHGPWPSEALTNCLKQSTGAGHGKGVWAANPGTERKTLNLCMTGRAVEALRPLH